MKKLVLMICAVLTLSLVACTSDDSNAVPKGYEVINGVLYPQTPDWVFKRIQLLQDSAKYAGSKVDLYYWSNAFYYLINVPAEKTRGRYLFRVDGTRVVIESEVLRDFYFHRQFRLNIWTDYRNPHPDHYVQATLNTGLKFEQVLSFIYEQPVLNTSLLCSFTTAQTDSLESLKSALGQKLYLTTSVAEFAEGDSLIRIRLDFNGIKSQAVYTDWTNLTNHYKLMYNASELTSTVFYVPKGEELEWTKRLFSYEGVNSTN